jgi:hypothetical protein
MTPSITRAKHVRSTAGKTLLAVALASTIGGLSVGPALGQERGWHQQEQQDRGRHQRDWRDDRRRRVYRPVYAPRVYAAPVYAPPPVVYVPAPSAGVHLFFPLFR